MPQPTLNNLTSEYFHQIKQNKASWLNSFASSMAQDYNHNYLPWITYNAIKYLQQNLTKNDIIFEYGAGTSTLFYQGKIKYLISIESNKFWYKIITNKINNQSSNNLPNFIKNIDLSGFNQIFSYKNGIILLLEDGQKNNLYQNFITNFKPIFNYIIIDSLKRYDCSLNSINYITPNGIIIIDDSQRKSYAKIYRLMQNNNFTATNYPGIAPGQLKAKNTTFFKKNDS